MELGSQIKKHRTGHGLSQEDLAAKIYVSRQTVSNWETDKTYPDVENLLLLSVLFDITIDELIKGDVEAMKEAISEDAKKLNHLSWIMLVFLAAMLVALVVCTKLYGLIGILPALVLWGIAMVAALKAERIKKNNDVLTFKELLAFSQGKSVDRDPLAAARTRGRTTRILLFIATLAIGALAGYVCYKLFM